MDLTRDIDSIKRRVRKIAKAENPPELSLRIFTEEEWNNKKPTDQSQWELNLIIEEKRPLIVKDQANSLDASRFSLSSTCK